MDTPMGDEKAAYEAMKNRKEKFGAFHKTCFHVHTPESYDYKLLSGWTDSHYQSLTDQEVYNLCIEKKVFPVVVSFDSITLDGNCSCYSNKKELFAFLLLADTIISNNIEIVLVADHHTINGISKLKIAINELCRIKQHRVYPEIICGIEISCADKNHVVGIFENNQNNVDAINKWLKDNLLSVEDGSFETSIKVLKFLKSINGIGYIAHLDTSDVFKGKYLSGAYKKKLFSDDVLQLVGLSDYKKLDYIKTNIVKYNTSDIKFLIDNDSHDIDSIKNNTFWIKGSKRNYSMIKEAINDYDISISFDDEQNAKQFIKGIYVENRENGFLYSKDKNAFSLSFSNSLNCLIGGRGTGKSTVLELLEYILSQRSENEKQLDFICAHGNAWLLYEYYGDEYLVEMRMPIKENSDDSILRCFGQNLAGKYRYGYYYNRDHVRNFAFSHYFKISKVVYVNDEWLLETVANKREMLRKFFDVRYSVNDLVNTASGEQITQFIYDTLFDNKTLSRPEDVIRLRKKSGLKKALDDAQNALLKRNEEVDSVVNPFNSNQANILRIIYSQSEIYLDPEFNLWLFGDSYGKDKWYEWYNITYENIIEFLLVLYGKLGIFDFLTMVINQDVSRAATIANFLEFCTDMTPNMIEQGINSLNSANKDNVVNEIFSKLITDNNIEMVIDYLKKYIAKVEKFALEFNINNKEGSSRNPIYRPVGDLSLGQKVVAMLSFVLGYSEYSEDYRPLIIDQPEDNLDNQYIYKNLVKQLRTIKEKRQVIIATHNATIVTNAKADQVCVMESDNIHGWIHTTGYPGEKRIKNHIINYLEGGKESFLHKLSVYQDALDTQIQWR